MIRIIKGDITLECETQADVRLALGVFTDVDVPALPEITVGRVESGGGGTALPPAWRVGGPVLSGVTKSTAWPAVPTESDDSDMLKLSAVPALSTVPEHIPVSACNLEALEAVMLFPEGVPTRGLQELLGLSQTTVSGRLGKLQKVGLIERVPHRNLWRATSLARRAKLVRS